MSTLLDHRERSAMKIHQCSYCLRSIVRGVRYLDQRVASDGSVYTYRAHLDCHSAYWSWRPDEDEYVELSELTYGHLPPCRLAWAWPDIGPAAPCTCPHPQPATQPW